MTRESGWSPLSKNGQPLHVVPVQMGQQDGAGEGPSLQEGGDPTEAGSRIEQQGGRRRAGRGHVDVGRERHAGRVAAVANEFGSGGRCRSASTAEMDPHPISIAPGLRGGAPRTAPRDPIARVDRPRPRPPGTAVTASSVEVRAPSFEVGPLPEEGARPVLGQALTVVLDPDHPVEDEEDLGARFSLLGEDAAGRELVRSVTLLPAHDPGRERAFQRRLHRRHQRLGVLVAPGGVAPERLAVPVLEVGESRLVREGALPVVDPVTGEPAGSGQGALARDRRRAG